jgi:hypothetical protein
MVKLILARRICRGDELEIAMDIPVHQVDFRQKGSIRAIKGR